jgi:phosphoribosylaminoimidazolecarboxamide formyltransferase/IMP cyclohydrolase
MEKVAFISVFEKEGIDIFTRGLIDLGWQVISSSGTAKFLREHNIKCKDLADLVGKPILGHRVVSLSREFYAMLLSRLENKDDMEELRKLNLPIISLVCCDMYPLEEEIEKNTLPPNLPLSNSPKNPREERRGLESVLEKTDIGGPTMLRAAAKGERIVICDKNDREEVLLWLRNGEPEKKVFKRKLAAKAEFVVAKYCLASAEYLSGGNYKGLFAEKIGECCYGENAYQAPAFIYQNRRSPFSPDKFKLLTETPLSYNNFCDRDKILQTLTHLVAGLELNLEKPVSTIAIAVKHGNACGAGISSEPKDALKKMIEGDVQAIHGGSIFANFKIDEDLAEILLHYQMPGENRRLLDTITAPEFTSGAVEILARKKGKCRIAVNPSLIDLTADSLDRSERWRHIRDGFLSQPNYTFIPKLTEAIIKGDGEILNNKQKITDLILAWAVGSTSNSNTITIVKNGKLLANGVGQQDRVGAAKLALWRADDANQSLANLEALLLSEDKASPRADLSGAVAYSDSFFPFPDAPQVLIDRGIKIIFATSGSINDKEVITACLEQGATLVLFPDKIARGFAWH